MRRYVGVDVHSESCSICILQGAGKRARRDVVATNGSALVEYFRQLPGQVHVCIEETEWAAWIWEILSPHVSEMVVVQGERRRGASKSDALAGRSAHGRTGRIDKSVFKATREFARLRELARVYWAATGDLTRAKNRLKSSFRRRGIRCVGTSVYSTKGRSQLIRALPSSMRDAATVLGDQADIEGSLGLRSPDGWVVPRNEGTATALPFLPTTGHFSLRPQDGGGLRGLRLGLRPHEEADESALPDALQVTFARRLEVAGHRGGQARQTFT